MFRKSSKILLSLVYVLVFLGYSNNSLALTIQKIGVEQGLPQSAVRDIKQDKHGFIWVATEAGLARYDGYIFKQYSHQLVNDRIFKLHIDKQQQLWVASEQGVYFFDDVTDTFLRLKSHSRLAKELNNQVIRGIESTKNALWIMAQTTLYKYEFSSQNITNIPFPAERQIVSRFINQNINTGELWVHTAYRSYAVDQENNQLLPIIETQSRNSINSSAPYLLANGEVRFYSNGMIWCSAGILGEVFKCAEVNYLKNLDKYGYTEFKESIDGTIWVGKNSHGLFHFNENFSLLKQYKHSTSNLQSLSNNDVMSLTFDRQNNLWLGILGGGINKISHTSQKLILSQFDSNDQNSLSHNHIRSFYQQNKDNFWIGTFNGLNHYNKKTNHYKRYLVKPGFDALHPQNFIKDIAKIDQLNLMIAIATPHKDSSFWLFNIEEFTWSPISIPEEMKISSGFDLLRIDNVIWVSMVNLGLFYFDLETSLWQRPKWLPKKKSPPYINQLYYDNKDNLWIGSMNEGILRYNFTSNQLSFYKNTIESTNLNGNWIKSFLQDARGGIWVGSTQGLMKYQPETDNFQFLSLREDGTKDTIYGLLQDDSHYIWASTNQGLVKFHPNSFEDKGSLIDVRYFNQDDGLQGNEFNTGAFLKAKDGTFYFGGTNGFNSFDPQDFLDISLGSSPIISELKIFNQSVSVNEKKSSNNKNTFTLPQPIHLMSELNLSYQHQLFSLAFSAMNYENASQQIYAYRLIGLFEHWIETDRNSRLATFSGLPPGNYQFQVKSKTAGESWSLNSRNDKITELAISISPPWWMSYYAYIIYLFMLVLIPFLFFHQRSQLIRKRAIALEKEVKLRTSQLKAALIQKEEVFTNISHEFRTPLTLMIGPAEELIDSQNQKDIKQTGERIKRNGELLLRLVNQLLGIARSEQEEIDKPHNILDLSLLVEHICQRFETYANSTQLSFSYNIEANILINASPEQIEPIISNILSNAFKYTQDNGTIKLELLQRDKKIICEISDNGQGIATNELNKIFERFYRSSNNKENNQSSGIGLSLVKALVTKTNGNIEVSSSLGKGTQFIVSWNDKVTTDGSTTALIQYSKDLVNTTYTKKEISILNFPHYYPKNIPLDTTKPCLLIVEDHVELNDYLMTRLSNDYACLSATNGEQGVEFAIKHQPKVIISDIMMPKLDGFGLCEKIKTNHLTSHIPIILLTAKADQTSRIKGLIKEANIYLSKPFDFIELSLHIRNLLNDRENLKKQFCIALDNDHWEKIELPKEDSAFLDTLNNAMNDHYSDHNFQAIELAKIIGFSERQLQRKFKAFSGITPTHFIRQWRLNQSRRLLLQGHPIGNIALDCGFNSQAYFGKCFKQQFSMTPSEYLDLNNRTL